MKVYISAPYGRRKGLSEKDCEGNVLSAIKAARSLITEGHIPFIPHLYHYVNKGWVLAPDEDKWLELCKAWVLECDAVLRLPGQSFGADSEVELAQEFNIPIYYSVEELIG